MMVKVTHQNNVPVRQYSVGIGISHEVQLRVQYYDKELLMVFWWMTSYCIPDVPKLYSGGI